MAEIGTAVAAAIIALIIIGLVLSFWKKLYMTMTLAIVNFIIFFIWRFSVEGTLPFEGAWPSYSPVYQVVVDNLSLRYNVFTIEPSKMYTLFTHMYLHFGFMHILSNMIFLVLFGMPFEERVGAKAMAGLYFASGIAASVIDAGFSLNYYGTTIGQMLGTPPYVPHIGASGAIFGIMGAFVALYPRDKVYLPIGIIFMRVPVYLGALAYAGIETILAFSNPEDNIGHMVHVMGFLSGMILAVAFSKYIKGEIQEMKEGTMDFESLKELATNYELKDMFNKIKDEDEPDIRRAWLEKYAESAVCPECGSPLKLSGRKIKCKCGYNLKF